ncbi:hypothetical protein GTQ41_17100 [Pseudomonas sp. AN-B15]|uniref:hypothetical protein n=1 Tax=Pseudomonas sp. AN-B15 TaxID=2697023 RepID=UPI001C2C831A|nr:hypothetical protein [Pseudomonas sp. AN-B15]QXE10703.1 hypothetical protein GTQ41_17100 [Pseudomonas sp. AN-B15]
MREQFETAIAKNQQEGKFAPASFERCGLDGRYVLPELEGAWWGWQASRDALVIELPNRYDEKYQEYFDDVEGGSFNESKYLADVKLAIEALGLRVTP